jgi:hypothetical protein
MAARKRSGAQGPRRRAKPRTAATKPAKPPVDNPRLRWQELASEQDLADAKEVRALAGTGRAAAKNLAELRLQALEAAQAMNRRRDAADARDLRASNWIELGRRRPEGQTYGGARVIVTGRRRDRQHPTDASITYVGPLAARLEARPTA